MKSIRLAVSASLLKIFFVLILLGFPAGGLFAQKTVTINTGNANATVYVDKEEAGKGSSFTAQIAKQGVKQVMTRIPGYKDSYSAIVQLDKVINLKSDDKLVNRGTGDKFIEISNIGLDLKDKKNIKSYTVSYSSTTLMEDIDAAEKKKENSENKAEMEKAKKKGTKNQLVDESETDNLSYDDTKFSANVYKTLKMTGFIDTVNRVFADNNNTLVLEGTIKKIFIYNITSGYSYYCKSKLFLTWYIKNAYNEILDSVDTKEYSGDFVIGNGNNSDHTYEKMYGDAVDISYLRLHKDGRLAKYIKLETNFACADPMLSLPVVKSAVAERGDASVPSVIIKTKDGHGSGFAITQDGYIITNYHVVAGKYKGKLNSVKVVTSSGDELPGTIVRYNKARDLALIKVDHKFEKAFKVSNVKSFKNLMDIYTIGAPKSIELGQSFSSGILSSERKSNNNDLLQLGMSVNGGNSGGPVFDTNGNLHGVIVSKLIGNNTEGVSFAIPGYLIGEYLNIQYK